MTTPTQAPLPPDDLDRLAALAGKATPGPWDIRNCNVMVPTKRFTEAQANRDYVHGLDPQTIMRLIEMARRGM